MTPQECAANFLSVAYKKPLNFKPVAPSLSDTVYKSNSNWLLMAEAASNPIESTVKVVDICALPSDKDIDTKFLIQPDHFMTVTSLNAPKRSIPRKLHYLCKGGDHYMVCTRKRKSTSNTSSSSTPAVETRFVIIKKKTGKVTEVDDLESPRHNKTYNLCSAYEDGQYFLADRTRFYIIKSNFTFIETLDLQKGCIDETPRKLHGQLQKGKFYFSSDYFFYVVKENGGQITYQRACGLGMDAGVEHQEVIISETTLNFLRNEYQPSNEKGMLCIIA